MAAWGKIIRERCFCGLERGKNIIMGPERKNPTREAAKKIILLMAGPLRGGGGKGPGH